MSVISHRGGGGSGPFWSQRGGGGGQSSSCPERQGHLRASVAPLLLVGATQRTSQNARGDHCGARSCPKQGGQKRYPCWPCPFHPSNPSTDTRPGTTTNRLQEARNGSAKISTVAGLAGCSWQGPELDWQSMQHTRGCSLSVRRSDRRRHVLGPAALPSCVDVGLSAPIDASAGRPTENQTA